MANYPKLKVFENGGMIQFATEADELITSEPKGSVRIRQVGEGFSFEHIITCSGIASVTNFADILDSSGVVYGASFADVLTALSFFFEVAGGGGTVTGANNGLSLDGANVQLGGALVKNTTITENGFQAVQTRLETVNSEPVSVSHYTENNDPFSSGIPGYSRLLGVASATGNAYCGIWSNNADDATAFLRAEAGDWQSNTEVRATSVLLKVVEAGIIQSSWSLQGNAITAACDRVEFFATTAVRFHTDKVEQQITGKYIFGESNTDGSIRIGESGGAFVVEKRIGGVWVVQNIAPAPVTIAKDELIFCDSFVQPAITSNWFSSTASGGAIDLNQLGETGVVGMARFSVSNSVTSRYGILAKGISGLVRTYQDGNTFLYKTKIRPEALGSLTNRFVINMGFLSSTAVLNPTVGLYFCYDFTDSQRVNPAPANWSLVSRVNNVDKVVLNSGVPVVIGLWTKLAIRIDTATNTAMFYINGILVGSIVWNVISGINSNLPMVGASTECSWGALLANSGVAATGTGLRIDYIDVYKDFG